MARIERLEALARDMVGDGETPDLFFVTDRGNVVCIETSAPKAYRRWKALAARRPLRECCLENRTYGTICSVEPQSDEDSAPLEICDGYMSYVKS